MTTNIIKVMIAAYVFLFAGSIGSEVASGGGVPDLQEISKILVAAISEKDIESYAHLFADRKVYIGWRHDNPEMLSEWTQKQIYLNAQRQFLDDLYELSCPSRYFGRARTVRWIAMRIIGDPAKAPVRLEVKVEYGDENGTGIAYINTGNLIRTPDGWCFVERMREPMSMLPARKTAEVNDAE